ncbi:hypothetical protein GCM10014715_58470 [Streptomyces spiralis]|uniref:Uncharacterized protein n=1 Tax=Streptomyces spiralis TaxID=66376 RepID=A0A919A8X4_9ACTN|nr:hypothetical protein GCM10014715_58470 [Streptomyces spiralis]
MTSPRSAGGPGAVAGFTGDAALAAGDRLDALAPGRLGDLGGAVTVVLKEGRSSRYVTGRALPPAVSLPPEPEHPGAAGAW